MLNYTFTQDVKILSGVGCVQNIGTVILEAGYKKAFIVFDEGIRKAGILDKVEDSLHKSGIEFCEYGKVLPDPPAEIVDEGALLCKENNCDCVIAIGGGSSIDTGKGINILRFNEGNILDYAQKDMCKCSGLITIPTTSGTGSELSNGAIISDTKNHVKVPILCFNNMPEYAILDPELTIGMPYGLTLMTGLDVFSHAAESYTSIGSNAMTDFICEKIMQTVIENLPLVLTEPGNINAREKMQCAASIGGWMLYSASAHVGHSIAHVLGSQYHIVHGAACAYTLPTLFKLLANYKPEKIRYIGTLLGAKFSGNEKKDELGKITADAFNSFVERLELPKMDKHDTDDKVLEELVNKVVKEPLALLSPVKIDKDLAREMLKDILS